MVHSQKVQISCHRGKCHLAFCSHRHHLHEEASSLDEVPSCNTIATFSTIVPNQRLSSTPNSQGSTKPSRHLQTLLSSNLQRESSEGCKDPNQDLACWQGCYYYSYDYSSSQASKQQCEHTQRKLIVRISEPKACGNLLLRVESNSRHVWSHRFVNVGTLCVVYTSCVYATSTKFKSYIARKILSIQKNFGIAMHTHTLSLHLYLPRSVYLSDSMCRVRTPSRQVCRKRTPTSWGKQCAQADVA